MFKKVSTLDFENIPLKEDGTVDYSKDFLENLQV